MTSISQQIPNFIQGISDQPDQLKKPGQVRDLVNAYPDITLGLQKRVGHKFINELVGTGGPDGFWQEIQRESVEGKKQKFLLKIGRGGDVDIFNVDTGEPCNVYWNNGDPLEVENLPYNINSAGFPLYNVQDPNQSARYLQHDVLPQQYLKALTINDLTLVANPQKNINMSSSPSNTKFEAFVDLKVLAYNRSYDLDINLLNTDGVSNYSTVTEAQILDVERLETPSSCQSTGTFNVTLGYADNIDTNFTIADPRAEGLRVELRTIGQVIQVGDGDSDGDFECRYTHFLTLQSGGTYWNEGDKLKVRIDSPATDPWYTIQIKKVQNITSKSEIVIRNVNTPSNADSALSAEVVLEQLKTEIEGSGLECEVLGTGLYVTHTEPFVITTTEADLFGILSQDDTDQKIIVVNDVSQLPLQCKKGLNVKISNTFGTEDDYYVEFISTDGVEDSADGHWEEIAKPGTFTVLNPESMPHAIIKAVDESPSGQKVDSFVVTPINWNARTCGDDSFNPSFVQRRINNLLFFRSRLVFLSGENVIMTRPNDLFNFFPKTALTTSAVDPVDISASSKQSSVLHDGIVINNGIVLLSAYDQFLLTTANDSLRSETVKISQISSYDYNTKSRPFSLGTNLGFLGTGSLSTRFYEMTNIFTEGQVDVVERSKIVQRSITSDLNLTADSKENGFVAFGKFNEPVIWCYRYYKTSSQDNLQSAWFKWELPHGLVYHFMDEDTYYIVLQDNGKLYLLSTDLTDNTSQYDNASNLYYSYSYLDYWSNVPASNIVFGKNKLTLNYPGPQLDRTMYLITPDNVYIPESNRNGNTFTFNYRYDTASDVKVGYSYEYKVELPTIHLLSRDQGSFRADTSSSLTLHRVKLNVGSADFFTVDLGRFGRDNYTMEFSTPTPDGYPSNSTPVLSDRDIVVPIYDRNTNITLTLTSSQPTPCSLYSLRWEGSFTNNFYKRA